MLSLHGILRVIFIVLLASPATATAMGHDPGAPIPHAAFAQADQIPIEGDEDWDGDALTNSQEASAGTDPNNPDTDGDGLGDSQELQLGTHPLSSDSDGDGVSDPEELQAGTDPMNWDTDGNGLSDGQERSTAMGTDPGMSGDDSASDCSEHFSGTDSPLAPGTPKPSSHSAPQSTTIPPCRESTQPARSLATPVPST